MTFISRILLPTDFSPSAALAAEFAADLAHRYDATIDVVHAWQPHHDIAELIGWFAAGDQQEETASALAEYVEARCGPLLRQLLGVLESKQVREVRGLLEPGQPSQVILDLAESDRYDLIVIASHGRTGLADVLIGSCVERVVRRSPIPVLVVPIAQGQLRSVPWYEGEHESQWFSAATPEA